MHDRSEGVPTHYGFVHWRVTYHRASTSRSKSGTVTGRSTTEGPSRQTRLAARSVRPRDKPGLREFECWQGSDFWWPINVEALDLLARQQQQHANRARHPTSPAYRFNRPSPAVHQPPPAPANDHERRRKRKTSPCHEGRPAKLRRATSS